jgi:hypothetical protein
MTDLEQQLTDHLRRRAAEARPRFDLEAIEQGSSLGSLVDLDGRHPRRAMVRSVVAAAVVVLALIGALALLEDDHTVNTAPANTGAMESTTTEAPRLVSFGPPFFNVDLRQRWTVEQGDGTPFDIDFLLINGPPQSSIKLAIPDAATPEDAVAEIASKAPSLYVLSDPVDTNVGNMPATCMSVEPPEGAMGGATLFKLRDPGGDAFEVAVAEGAVGRICVVDVERDPVIVLVQAPTAEFAAFLEEAQVLLDGVEFDQRERAQPPG